MSNGSTTATTVPPPQFEPWYYILEGLLGVLAVFGNGFVVFLVISRRCLQVNPNFYILSLAIADLLLCTTLPLFSILCSHVMQCDWKAFYKFFNFFTYASIANLFLMTCDRLLAINCPLWYIRKITRFRLSASIAFAWIFPAIFAMLPFIWMYDSNEGYVKDINNIYYLTSLVIFELLPVVSMPMIYVRIFIVVRKHSRQVTRQREQVSYNNETRMKVRINETIERKATIAFEDTPRVKSTYSERRHQGLLERDGGSSTLVLGLVILLFVLCWAFDIYITLCTRVHLCAVKNNNEEGISNLLIYLNSTVNPFVYFLFKKDVRRELKACLPRYNTR